ncbi:MAG: class I SAM-dependent methyltransferase [Pseudomonadota bacterium]
MHELDVPSPIDLCDPVDALEWERAAQSRPGRAEMFQSFAAQLQSMGRSDLQVLELGSGPAFLAEYLLSALPELRLSLLDFSQPMDDLARIRLAERASGVRFLHRSFEDQDWTRGLGKFDAVITNQAVHELRHKRYAQVLHSQVAEVLAPGGSYLVCDHYFGEGGMGNDQLYMSSAPVPWLCIVAPNNHMQRAVCHKMLGRGRGAAESFQVICASMLKRERPATDVSR